jgi:hypothetical protein
MRISNFQFGKCVSIYASNSVPMAGLEWCMKKFMRPFGGKAAESNCSGGEEGCGWPGQHREAHAQ